MRMKEHVVIDRAAPEVFAAITKLEESPVWARSSGVIERRKTTDGPVGVGTEFAALDRILGMRRRFVVRITEFDPHRRVGAAWTEPIGGGWTASFDGSNGSTTLVFTAETNPSGALRLVASLLAPIMKRAMRKDLARFKAWVEGNGG